jgi:sigma-B regulation protein RsbU (phosphoserine phosphatase)
MVYRTRPVARFTFWLCLGLLVGARAFGQAAIAPVQTTPVASTTAPAEPAPLAAHPVLALDGPWRFQIGDDPRWADPAFDDSSWQPVVLSHPLEEQGVGSYSGYAWYRMRLLPQQLAAFGFTQSSTPMALLVTGDGIGQISIFSNGVETGHTKGMTDEPREYESPAFTVQLSAPDAAGARLIAIRAWAGPEFTIGRGLVDKVELGAPSDIADRLTMALGTQWNEHATSASMVTFLFFCVAMLGAALYLAQRNHSEYLWLTLMCLSVAFGGAAEAAFGLALLPLSIFRVVQLFSGHIFMAITLEFVLRFTGSPYRKLVRGVQIGFLLLPFVWFLHITQIYDPLSVAAEVLFCGLVTVLLFLAWRGGRGEAGVMLVPFFLASTADSAGTVIDFLANLHVLPQQFANHRLHLGPIEYGIGTVSYTIFLGSLVAVILYRFIRVSQDEQRNNAEISAARSVQALLIPTHLPSTRNFMLESAYLPINGVGGDFFQVLPLKDDSLMIVVGDVSGKGLQAAMNSSTLVGAFRNELANDPATVLEHLNHVLIGAVASPGAVPEIDAAPCFATCLCARIYPDGKITIANAGHLSPYRDGRELAVMPSLPLGVLSDMKYDETSFQLNRGDRLVFLSDGVVEATNPEGELFGFERTRQVSNEPARYIAQTAKHFGQTDDITVVSLYLASVTAQPTREPIFTSK